MAPNSAHIGSHHEQHFLHNKYRFVTEDERLGPRPGGLATYLIDRSHCKVPVPTHLPWQSDLIAEMETKQMEQGDVLLVTAPKTGTHWCWEILSMLTSGKAKYRKVSKHRAWLEWQRFDDIMASQSTPRVLNTHLTLSSLPPNFRHSTTKTIVCMRNPRDTMVSLYHHFKQHNLPTPETYNWNNQFKFSLYSKTEPFGNIFDHFADSWDRHRHDPNVLIIFYEDLKENTKETIRRMANHIGVNYTDFLLDDITSAVQFDKMKSGKYPSEARFRNLVGNPEASLYRKGMIGDWRSHFTNRQDEEFTKFYEEWNRHRQVPFRFLPSVKHEMTIRRFDPDVELEQ